MKRLSIKILPLMLMAFIFISCEKNDTSLNGAGNTINKITNGGADPIVSALDFKDELQEIVLLDVRRDIPNSTELMKEATITISNTQALLDAYNTANETLYELMPNETYQLVSNPNLTVSADRQTWTVKFAPGEYVTQIKVKIDASQFDLSKAYAFGFKITTVTQGEIHGDLATGLFNILIKNELDGKYEVTGTMVDSYISTITSATPFEYDLETLGSNLVIGYEPTTFFYYYVPILSSGNLNVYGSFCPIFVFDKATKKITAVINAYGQPAGNTRSAQLDPSGINAYDDNKNIDVKFFMKQPSVITTAPNIRTTFDWHLEYLGDR